MRVTFKILTAMMALLLLFSLVATLSACNDQTTKPPEGTDDAVSQDDTLPALDVVNLGGREIMMLWPEVHSDGHYLHNELAVTELTSDVLDQAIMERNYTVEGLYNVTISVTTDFISTIPKTIRNSSLTGTVEQSVIASTIKFMTPLALEGLLQDFNDLQYYYEEDQPWWNHDLMQDFAVANARYFASGDIIYSDDFYPYCTYVNTAVSDAYSINENYYELVKNKQWTLEKFHELAAKAVTDLDGQPTVWSDQDMNGAIINANFFKAGYYSAGVGMLGFDAEGYPAWQMTKEHGASVLEKLIRIVHNDSACVMSDKISNSHATAEMDLFTSGKSLFLVEELIIAERINKRDVKLDFQILPFPLYEEGDDYVSVLNDALILSIPAKSEDKDDVSLILSAMSRESVNTLTPAFFETVLTYRYMQNADSVETLRIILNSTVAPDVATIQDWGGFMTKFKELGSNASTDFASAYQTNIGTAMKLLEEYCVMLDKFYGR